MGGEKSRSRRCSNKSRAEEPSISRIIRVKIHRPPFLAPPRRERVCQREIFDLSPPPSRYRLLIVVEQSTARYSKRKFRVIATKRRRKRSKNKQVKPCLRSCSRLSIPNNTFPPSSFDSLQGTKWRVFRHDFPTVNTHPSSLLISINSRASSAREEEQCDASNTLARKMGRGR